MEAELAQVKWLARLNKLVREMSASLPEPCGYQFFPTTFHQPGEWCENEAEPGEHFCSDHQPHEPDWDSPGKDRRHGFDD